MGAAFGPVTLLALYWRRFNAWGAAASIVAGTATASASALLDGGPSGIWDIEPATPGFAIASAAALIVTGLTPSPLVEVVRLFDRVNSGATGPLVPAAADSAESV
jgi:sodium/proline symporter